MPNSPLLRTSTLDVKREVTETCCASPMSENLTGHILMVEDNPANRKVIKAMLDRLGLHSDFVEDGQQAVDAISGGMTPDLVLMDCQMPVMDGYEATQRIRRWETENNRPRLPIVALTANTFDDDRTRCFAVGMDDFLEKPINIEKLKATLERWLCSVKVNSVCNVSNVGTAEVDSASQADASSRQGAPPVFDEVLILSYVGGDRELAKVIIRAAMIAIPGDLDHLERAIAAGNWTEVERYVHMLKGMAAQIGGMRFSARLRELDDHHKEGGKTDRAAVIDLRREYQTLSAALPEWLR